MIDISSGHHILIQIKPSFGDDWVDHDGNKIVQLGFATIEPKSVVVNGSNLAAIYDCDLGVGQGSHSFEDFPLNPVERLADFTFSINGVWSDPEGNISTSNFLWWLQDINSSHGKVLNLINREIRLIVSTSVFPGLIYNQSTGKWEQVGIHNLTVSDYDVPQLPIPLYQEQEKIEMVYRIEEIKLGRTGRIEFNCTSLYGDVEIGSPVAFAGADQMQIKPIVYGDFTGKFAPVAIEKTLDKVSRIHIEEDTLTRFDSLMVYDKENDVEWSVSSDLNRNGTKIDFSQDFDTAYNARPRAAGVDDWVVVESESAVLPTDDAPDQKLFIVDSETVGFHTRKVTSVTIDGVTYPPMASRGWGGGSKDAHSANTPYRLVDAAIQQNALILGVELIPTKIYDSTPTDKEGDWNAHDPNLLSTRWEDGVGAYPSLYGFCANQRELAGNPWSVVANSKDGGPVDDKIILSTSQTEKRRILVWDGNTFKGYTRYFTEIDLVCEFPDLSGFNGEVLESKIYLDAKCQNGLQVRFDGAHPTDPVEGAWGTLYAKNTTLTVHTNTASDLQHYVFGVYSSDANTIQERKYSDPPLDSGKTIGPVRLQAILVPTSTGGKPYVIINAIKIKAKIKIPITSDLKICSKMLGRLASTGNATTSAVIGDLLYRYLGSSCIMDFADGHSVSVVLNQKSKLRDVLRDVALAGCSALSQTADGFRLTQWSSSDVFSVNDDNVQFGENNQPMVSYELPKPSSVYSSFELKYGWDHMREKYTRSLVVNNIDYVWDGIKNDPTLWQSTGRGVIMRGWCQSAAGWLGAVSTSPLVIESKVIQDSRTAEDCLLRIVEWMSKPRMSMSATCDWAKTQDLNALDCVSVVVTGLPQRLLYITWVVVGNETNLEAMERKITLIEKH